MNASGGAVVVWDRATGPDCVSSPASLTCIHTVEAVSRSSSGEAWSSPVPIARPGVGAAPRAAVNDSGRAAISWVHDIGRDRVLQATYRTGPREPFPNPSDLSAAVLEVRSHRVALDPAGDVVAVWAERHVDVFDVAAEVRSVSSGVWGAPVVLSHGAVTAGPSLAVAANGEAFAVWAEDGVVQVARGFIKAALCPSGTAACWDAPVALSPSFGEAGGEPVVVVDSLGDAVAVWLWRERPRGQVILQAAYRPVGGAWGAPLDLAKGRDLSTDPDVALDEEGNAVVVWRGVAGGLQAATRARVGRWSPPVDLGRGSASDAHIAVDARGDAVAVWRNDTAGRLQAAMRPTAAGAWQPAFFLSTTDASAPRVALDAAGNGAAAWNTGSGDTVPVVSSSLTGGWQPTLANTRRPVVLGPAGVGRTVVCDRGEWEGTVPIQYAFRWLRNGHVLARASSHRYRVLRGDAGALLACRVTATNAARSLTSSSRAVRVGR